jgi:glucokinase
MANPAEPALPAGQSTASQNADCRYQIGPSASEAASNHAVWRPRAGLASASVVPSRRRYDAPPTAGSNGRIAAMTVHHCLLVERVVQHLVMAIRPREGKPGNR